MLIAKTFIMSKINSTLFPMSDTSQTIIKKRLRRYIGKKVTFSTTSTKIGKNCKALVLKRQNVTEVKLLKSSKYCIDLHGTLTKHSIHFVMSYMFDNSTCTVNLILQILVCITFSNNLFPGFFALIKRQSCNVTGCNQYRCISLSNFPSHFSPVLILLCLVNYHPIGCLQPQSTLHCFWQLL